MYDPRTASTRLSKASQRPTKPPSTWRLFNDSVNATPLGNVRPGDVPPLRSSAMTPIVANIVLPAPLSEKTRGRSDNALESRKVEPPVVVQILCGLAVEAAEQRPRCRVSDGVREP